MIDPLCVVEVGTHSKPYWKDTITNIIACDRHKNQFQERVGELGPFDWKELDI